MEPVVVCTNVTAARARFGGAVRLLLVTLLAALLVNAWPAAAQTTGDEMLRRIRELESQGRARPNEAARALEALLPAAPEHSPQRLELLTVQGLMLAVASQPEAAERSAARLENWGQEPRLASAPSAMAAALLIRARAMARERNLQQADSLMREAIARLPAEMQARDRYRFVLAHGYILTRTGKLDAAVRLIHEALALADQQSDLWRQSEARSHLSYAYYGAKQFERARALADEAIALAEKEQDPMSLARAYNGAGVVFDGVGDLQGELRSIQQALKYARQAGAKIDEALFLANMADFFLKNGDYKTALMHAEQALPLSRELHDTYSETVALANIGLAHISLQHFELGKRFVHESMVIDERRGAMTNVSNLWEELGMYLDRAGDTRGAVEAYHQHRRLASRLLHASEQKSILAMQEQYDADHRARALQLLQREGEIKAEQLRRGTLQQRLWWLLAAVFLLSFALVVLLYRRVRQTNRLLSASNQMLKVQSERDPLTGLANRRHFQAVMRQLAADGKLSGTVYLVDIDHFKHINDRHGHSAGDTVLVEVARRLRETLREQDLIVRWGGEEFLVVVQALSPEQVDALAERMLNVLDRTPIGVDQQRVPVTASIGFATFPIGPDALRVSWERAINLVDTAMYLAKAHGRNRAYGVRLLAPCDENSLESITRSLESAWRDGQVGLTLLQGGSAMAAAA